MNSSSDVVQLPMYTGLVPPGTITHTHTHATGRLMTGDGGREDVGGEVDWGREVDTGCKGG